MREPRSHRQAAPGRQPELRSRKLGRRSYIAELPRTPGRTRNPDTSHHQRRRPQAVGRPSLDRSEPSRAIRRQRAARQQLSPFSRWSSLSSTTLTPDSPEAMKTDHKIWRFDSDQDRLTDKPATRNAGLMGTEIQRVESSWLTPKRKRPRLRGRKVR